MAEEKVLEVNINPKLEALDNEAGLPSDDPIARMHEATRPVAKAGDGKEMEVMTNPEQVKIETKPRVYSEEEYLKLLEERDNYRSMATVQAERYQEVAKKLTKFQSNFEKIATKSEFQLLQEKLDKSYEETKARLDALTNVKAEPRYTLPQRTEGHVNSQRMYFDTRAGKMKPVPVD